MNLLNQLEIFQWRLLQNQVELLKKIGEILEYGPGTVLELDKLVGEPLNLYANGKFIAKGEVVVIDDNLA